jgi:hypothetical protein
MQFNTDFIDVWTLVHIFIPLLIGVLLKRKWWWIGIIIIVGYELIENLLLIYVSTDFFGESPANIISDIIFGLGATLLGSYISPFIFWNKKVQFRRLNLLAFIRGTLAVLCVITYFALILFYSPFIPIFDHFYNLFNLGIGSSETTDSAYFYLGFVTTLWAIDTLYTLYLGVKRQYRNRIYLYIYMGLNLFLTFYCITTVIVSIIWAFTISSLFLIFIPFGIALGLLSALILIGTIREDQALTILVMDRTPG